MEPYVVNIGRSLGSGGRAIGRMLAQQMGIAYYDREILLLAASHSGLCPEVFERSDEKNRFLRTLGNIIPFVGGGGAYYTNELSNENLFGIQSEAIRQAARKEACIFIGRCADYVLREHRNMVTVFVTADIDERIKNVCHRLGCSPDEARKLIESREDTRSSYYNYYTGKRWGDSSSYDLCVNSSLLGLEGTKNFIADFVRRVQASALKSR